MLISNTGHGSRLSADQHWAPSARFGSEREYKRQIINSFKNADEPESLIVVEMLLTGFDAPRNTVLYLTKQMQGIRFFRAFCFRS